MFAYAVTCLVSLLAADGRAQSVPALAPVSSLPDTTYPSFLTPSLRDGNDTTVSPCHDFDRFVNGAWRVRSTIPGGDAFLDVFSATSHTAKILLRALTDSARNVVASTTDPDLRVLGQYYASCLVAPPAILGFPIVTGFKQNVAQTDTTRRAQCQAFMYRDLSNALQQVFARVVLSPKSTARAMAMLNTIRQTAMHRVRSVPWLTVDMQLSAVKVLKELNFRVGIPAKPVDYSTVALTLTDFAANKEELSYFNWRHGILTVGTDPRSQWMISQYTANALYDQRTNSVEIPSFMFQWPFFDPTAEDAANFAAIGMVIGHEIHHGITNAIQFADKDAFTARTKRLVDQYAAMSNVEGYKVNGTLTLGENMADLGGFLTAYDAWQRTSRKRATPLIDGFTPEQRFFVYYARLWRKKDTPIYAAQMLARDPHAPGRVRINGVLMNVPAFAKAFGCKADDPMVIPVEQKSEIW